MIILPMLFFWIACIAFWIFCLVRALTLPESLGATKIGWVVAIIFLPLIAGILFLIIGPRPEKSASATGNAKARRGSTIVCDKREVNWKLAKKSEALVAKVTGKVGFLKYLLHSPFLFLLAVLATYEGLFGASRASSSNLLVYALLAFIVCLTPWSRRRGCALISSNRVN